MAGKQEKYIIKREYLGRYSVNEMLEKIIQRHIETCDAKAKESDKNDAAKPSAIL